MHTYVRHRREDDKLGGLFTVGFYAPCTLERTTIGTSDHGWRWYPLEDKYVEEDARALVSYLNGGEKP